MNSDDCIMNSLTDKFVELYTTNQHGLDEVGYVAGGMDEFLAPSLRDTLLDCPGYLLKRRDFPWRQVLHERLMPLPPSSTRIAQFRQGLDEMLWWLDLKHKEEPNELPFQEIAACMKREFENILNNTHPKPTKSAGLLATQE